MARPKKSKEEQVLKHFYDMALVFGYEHGKEAGLTRREIAQQIVNYTGSDANGFEIYGNDDEPRINFNHTVQNGFIPDTEEEAEAQIRNARSTENKKLAQEIKAQKGLNSQECFNLFCEHIATLQDLIQQKKNIDLKKSK